MNLELREIIDSIRILPLHDQAYLAKMVPEYTDTEKYPEISSKSTVGEYIGKIKISDDFNDPLPDEFCSGETDEIIA
ncbi:MAG: hypothetical protein AB7S75_18740 [Desulfococcaceae bacterium]